MGWGRAASLAAGEGNKAAMSTEPGVRLCLAEQLAGEKVRHLLKELIIFASVGSGHIPFVPVPPLCCEAGELKQSPETVGGEKAGGRGSCGHNS